MFEISFGELVLVLVVALLVLGPERLPKAASTLGRYAGQARSYLRGMMNQLQAEARAVDVATDLRKEVQTLQQGLREATSSISASAAEPTKPELPKSG